MANNLFVTTTEAKSGKSLVSLGLMEILKGELRKVAFFRPIITTPRERIDPDIDLIRSHFKLVIDYEDTFVFTLEEARNLINQDRQDEIIERILAAYTRLENEYDFVLIEGTDFAEETSAFEFDINADIANNLAAPVLIVTSARKKAANRTVAEIISTVCLARESFEERGCAVLGAVITRMPENQYGPVLQELNHQTVKNPLWAFAIPEHELLRTLTVKEIKDALGAEVLYGSQYLMRHARHHTVAAMQAQNFIERITEGSLVITPGDRLDIILTCVLSSASVSFPHIMGLILTAGIQPSQRTRELLESIQPTIPILTVKEDTLRTISRINEIDSKVSPADAHKIATALGIFESNVDTKALRERIITTKSTVVTPKMFEHSLIRRARENKQHIVLPEGNEERILRAAEQLITRDVVELTLLGNEEEIRGMILKFGLKLQGVSIVDPIRSPLFEHYAQAYQSARAHKGVVLDQARDVMADVSYFGTMMVQLGDADGMVSGSVNTTGHTLRPALEFVKTRPGFHLVSSVFFMCLEDRVLVYGDCAVNPNPDAAALAEIAIASAETAQMFGIEARVAMLSYSTGSSGKGDDVEAVREAARIAREKAPHLNIEGPMQYDAAVDLGVARTKMPDSKVAGQATVFIFPDLNTGNNTYKAVQRSAGAVAIGPVLQGLNKPVNDLSRGCTVADIVNTVAITAIQAQTPTG
ncbi:MAG: phosphate acetyltransferase [Leptospiraceae bacterium]|nr:phosphate acetyltransferase [Leptospiraceae bacterium]